MSLPRRQLVTRFAPSPTGYLHLGHVASALHVFGLGRAAQARVLLRLEDHDRSRYRAEYERAIFADLAWLGFAHDNVELTPDAPSVFRQSDNDVAYHAALARLAQRARVYGCDCTRKQIAEASPDDLPSDELVYSGRCRERGLPLHGEGIGLRVELPSGPVRFDDLELGPLMQEPARQCGDLLLRDRHGQWTYQFAVTVDDLDQGVDLVIRGQDLTSSTGRQILLGRMLGRKTPPRFYHHPLIHDDAGQKLGKRFFSAAVAKRREAGDRAEDVLGEAAYLVGLTREPRPLTPQAIVSLFQRDPTVAALARGLP